VLEIKHILQWHHLLFFWYVAEGAANPIILVPKQPVIATDIIVDLSFFEYSFIVFLIACY